MSDLESPLLGMQEWQILALLDERNALLAALKLEQDRSLEYYERWNAALAEIKRLKRRLGESPDE